MQLMSLLFFVDFTTGSQAPFLWRQGLSLLSAPKLPPEFVFLLKCDLDCSFSRRQALVQPGKATGQAHWGHVEALVFIHPSGLWSRGCPSDQVAGTACHYLKLFESGGFFTTLLWSFCELCCLKRHKATPSIHPCWTLKKCWSWLKRHIPSGDGDPLSKGM